MLHHGFLRVGAAVPVLRVADCAFNAARIIELIHRARDEGVAVVVFPELSLTGYTSGDLFAQPTLLRGALDALSRVVRASADFTGVIVVGMPLAVDGQLFNCGAVIHSGKVLGIVPKSFLPNYKEFYESRWFAPAATARSRSATILGEAVPFGVDLLFTATDVEGLTIGVEICEDLWVPIPPSCYQAQRGAALLLNLSASNEVIGKAGYRRQLVRSQSGRCIAAYVYASCGVSESSTDILFGGHCLIAENGSLLAESPRFQRESTLLFTDIDLERLQTERMATSSFGLSQRDLGSSRDFRAISFAMGKIAQHRLVRPIDAHPFVPAASAQLGERCQEIFQTQVAALAKRLDHIGRPIVTIGVSGGLDSTLALLVTCKTMDILGAARDRIHAFTMPGFGTTTRTLANARALMSHLGVTAREADIRPLCLSELRALGHRPFDIDLTDISIDDLTEQLRRLPPERRQDLIFENVQARMRTSILMNGGFVIGTGDLSELALGWCTYNGDHISMYNPNISIPKTLVQFLVRWAADNEFDDAARRTLLDVVATDISPELLPAGADGTIAQRTESVIGPYELHDFFLFHFLRYGAPPAKILFLAEQARFDRHYTPNEIRGWLRVFLERFFANQFKRSCLPDGPKVGTVSLSPRGDWRMPSDAQAALWLSELE